LRVPGAGLEGAVAVEAGIVGGLGTEVGSGVDDAAHLVEPPGSPFATAWAEVPDAPWCSTDGGRWDLQW